MFCSEVAWEKTEAGLGILFIFHFGIFRIQPYMSLIFLFMGSIRRFQLISKYQHVFLCVCILC